MTTAILIAVGLSFAIFAILFFSGGSPRWIMLPVAALLALIGHFVVKDVVSTPQFTIGDYVEWEGKRCLVVDVRGRYNADTVYTIRLPDKSMSMVLASEVVGHPAPSAAPKDDARPEAPIPTP